MRKDGEMYSRILAAAMAIGILFIFTATKVHCQTATVDRAQLQALIDQNAETKNTLAETMKRFWVVDENLKNATNALQTWNEFARALKTVKTIEELDKLCAKYQIPRDKAEPPKDEKKDGKEAAAQMKEDPKPKEKD